jgi:hypothetical protein
LDPGGVGVTGGAFTAVADLAVASGVVASTGDLDAALTAEASMDGGSQTAAISAVDAVTSAAVAVLAAATSNHVVVAASTVVVAAGSTVVAEVDSVAVAVVDSTAAVVAVSTVVADTAAGAIAKS